MTTIALTTDLSVEEGRALMTAAALAAQSGARLVSVHASLGDEGGFVSPNVLDLARAWGRAIEHVPMIHRCCDDVTNTVLDALRRIEPSLVVAGTHGRSGWLQLFAGSVAEGVARNVEVPTLLVPLEGRALVDASSGVLRFERVLVPVGDAEAARQALQATAWLMRMAGLEQLDVVLAHVEDGTPFVEVGPVPEGLRTERRALAGSIESSIAALATEMDASLVVMATRGHDGLLDAIAGTHTERVVRQVSCPVLSVPIR